MARRAKRLRSSGQRSRRVMLGISVTHYQRTRVPNLRLGRGVVEQPFVLALFFHRERSAGIVLNGDYVVSGGGQMLEGVGDRWVRSGRNWNFAFSAVKQTDDFVGSVHRMILANTQPSYGPSSHYWCGLLAHVARSTCKLLRRRERATGARTAPGALPSTRDVAVGIEPPRPGNGRSDPRSLVNVLEIERVAVKPAEWHGIHGNADHQ